MHNYYSIPPNLYDDQFWWKKDDIEFWKSEVSSSNNVLELGSGTGRIAQSFGLMNINYIGLDISLEYINYSKKKFLEFENLNFIHADMIDFSLNKKFDVIFIAFNSFLHLLNEQDASQCLSSIKKHMHKNSKLIIDIFVPHPQFLFRNKDSMLHILDFYNNSLKEEQFINEILEYNSDNEIANVHWLYGNNKKKKISEFKFQMKMYYPDTMNKILIDSGYHITSFWGSYEKLYFSKDSNLQIYCCQLK